VVTLTLYNSDWDRLVVIQFLTLCHPCFGLDPYFEELLGQIEQLGLLNESTVLLGYSAKCFLTLVKNCGDNRVRLPFRNETTIFTLYVDRVGRTYASLFRGLVLCNFFQFTVLALSFLWIILLTPNTVGSQTAERFWEASLVQVVFKNATTVAFHSVEKNKHFFKRFEGLCVYAISCMAPLATFIQWSKILTVYNIGRVQAGYVLWLQWFCCTVILNHSDLQLSA